MGARAPEALLGWVSFRFAGCGQGAAYGAGGICTCTRSLLWEVLVVPSNLDASGWSRGFAHRRITRQNGSVLGPLRALSMFLVKFLWKTGREVSGFYARGGELECWAEKLPSPAV